MRLCCFFCGKSVSTEVHDDTILRALCVCPECIPSKMRDDTARLSARMLRRTALAEQPSRGTKSRGARP
jgi:hypothetical protein